MTQRRKYKQIKSKLSSRHDILIKDSMKKRHLNSRKRLSAHKFDKRMLKIENVCKHKCNSFNSSSKKM